MSLLCWLVAATVVADRPNLLVLFTDDQTFRAIGYHNPEVKTPHLDRLAGQGVIFEHAYVASPICAASRASMMSGEFPQQHGVIALAHRDFAPYLPGGPRADRRLAHRLHQAGYHCAFWGKSHLAAADAMGFQEGKETRGFDDREAFAEAEAFLERAAKSEQPFFLWLAPRQPHVPLKPAQEWLDLYDEEELTLPGNFREAPPQESLYNQGIPGEFYFRDSAYTRNWRDLPAGPPRSEAVIRQFTKAYYATISHLDHQVGHLVARLETLGLADNTLIVFLSDNGYHLGSHGLGNKITLHEESVRVPMFVTGPGVATPGSRSGALVSSLDVYPTLLELAGADIPEHAMGRSLLPLLADPDAPFRDVVFSECTGVGGKPGDGHRMARNHDHKYVLTDTNEDVLFDARNDPFEQLNLLHAPTAGQPAALPSLRRAMAGWMQAIGDRPYPNR